MNFVTLFNALVAKYNLYADAQGKSRVETISIYDKIRIPCKVKRILNGTYGKIPQAMNGRV